MPKSRIETRIENLDKKVFFILSSARCRSSWFGNYFTYKDSFCYNEESRYITNFHELIDRIESRPEKYVGFEDPELLHYVESLYRLFPKATYVLLERNRNDAERSFMSSQLASKEYTTRKFNRWYQDIEKFKSIIPEYETIDFDQMDDMEEVKRIWNYILPDCLFDIDRWNLLTDLPIYCTLNKQSRHDENCLGAFNNLDKMDMIS